MQLHSQTLPVNILHQSLEVLSLLHRQNRPLHRRRSLLPSHLLPSVLLPSLSQPLCLQLCFRAALQVREYHPEVSVSYLQDPDLCLFLPSERLLPVLLFAPLLLLPFLQLPLPLLFSLLLPLLPFSQPLLLPPFLQPLLPLLFLPPLLLLPCVLSQDVLPFFFSRQLHALYGFALRPSSSVLQWHLHELSVFLPIPAGSHQSSSGLREEVLLLSVPLPLLQS